MLRHSKIGMSNIIGYFFSLSNMPMHDILKRKICKEKIKSKKIKNALKMIASMYSRICGSYRMYLEGDSLHQAVMIVCKLKWFSHISNHHNMYTFMQSCYSWYMCRYNVIWSLQCFTCINVCTLNYLNLVFEI